MLYIYIYIYTLVPFQKGAVWFNACLLILGKRNCLEFG